MAEEEVGFRLALKNRREVERGVHQVGDELNRTGDEADRVNRKARIAAGGMLAFGKSGRVAGRAVVAGTGAAVAGLVGAGIVLTKLSKDSIGEAREAQKVGAITRAEIKATGGAANISAKGVGNLAGAISAKVGIDDEAIQSGANMILTFKNVRNEVGRGNKIFDRATRSAVDLSAAGFGSITSQSKTLAKALNDPIKGMSALGKSGVTFTQQQQDTIKSLMKQGDLLGSQKIILGEVGAQVGGVAKAQATWGDKAKVMGDNIKESLGTAILPLLDRTQRWFVREGGPALQGYVDIFEKKGIPKIEEYAGIFERRGIPAMKNFLDEARPVATSVLPAIGTGFSTIADATKVIAPRMKSIFDGFNNLPDWAQKSIMIGAGAAVVGKKLNAFNLGRNPLGGVASMRKPLPVLVTNPGFSRGATNRNGTPIVTADDRRKPQRGPRVGGVPATLALLAASTNDDVGSIMGDPLGELVKEATWPWTEGPFKPKKWSGDAREMKAAQSDLNRVFQTGTARSDQYALSLSGVGRALGSIDRDVRPRLTIDGLDSALSKANSLSATLFGLPGRGTYGNGLGVLAPGPKRARPSGPRGGIAPRGAYPAPEPVEPLDPDFFGGGGGGGVGVDDRPIQLVLRDGRVLADIVIDDMERRIANR